jgi:hypothetical protein
MADGKGQVFPVPSVGGDDHTSRDADGSTGTTGNSTSSNPTSTIDVRHNTVREAERQSIRSTVGAYSVVGPEPGGDETAPAGTVTRNEAFQRSSIGSGGTTLATGSGVGSAAAQEIVPTDTGSSGLLHANHSIPETNMITPGAGGAHEEHDGSSNPAAAAAADTRACTSSPSPHHPEIEYLAEARLVEEEEQGPGEASRPWPQQSHSAGADGDGDPPPPYPDGIAGSVISDITPAILEAPVAPASASNNNNSHDREGPQQMTSSGQNEEVCVAKPLKDSFVLPRRYMFLVGAVVVAVVLGLGLGLGLTRSSSSAPPGSDVDTMVADLRSMDDGSILTYSPDPICFSLLPFMTNVSSACPDPASLPKGGPLNQLTADGILAAVRDFGERVDVSLINAGSLRGDIGVGDVTAGTIRKDVLPFGQDQAVVFSTTPADIKATLEGAIQDNKQWLALSEEESIEQQLQFFPNVPPLVVKWPFEASYPYASGLRYDVDLTAPNGQRVTNIEIKTLLADAEILRGSSTREWKRLEDTDDSMPIRIVSSAFLESGGDGYFPASSPHTDRVVLDVGITDLFVLYASKQETLIGPSIDDMSTKFFVPVAGWV